MGQFSKRLARRKPAKLAVPKPPRPDVDPEDWLVDVSNAFIERPDGSGALRIVAAADALLDTRAAVGPRRADRACELGCAHCCHMPVAASVPEALLIRTHLRERWPAAELASFTIALREQVARQAELDDDQLAHARERCALLGDDDRCRIYPVRPLACRGHASFSVERCAQSFADPERDDAVPVDVELREHKDKVKTTVATTSELSGCVSLEYELLALLARLLDGDDELARWVAGGGALAGVRVLAVSEIGHAEVLGHVRELVDGGSWGSRS